jgi:hypothetical protein
MTHVSERDFHDTVEKYLYEQYPDADIENGVYLSKTGRYADFIVQTEVTTYAVEVENDFESSIGGLGQAILYATHDPEYTPLLAVPAKHTEEPEWTLMKQSAVICIEVPHEEE